MISNVSTCRHHSAPAAEQNHEVAVVDHERIMQFTKDTIPDAESATRHALDWLLEWHTPPVAP